MNSLGIDRRRLLTGLGAGFVAVPLASRPAVASERPNPQALENAIILTAEIKAKAGQEDAVKEVLAAMVAPTRKEKGCLCYNLHQSKKDKSTFLFYEQWADQAAFDAHGKTSHMADMGKGLKGKVEGSKVVFFDMVD